MKIRTIYQKVKDLPKAKAFWAAFLGLTPVKDFPNWFGFELDNINFALLLNDFGDPATGSNTVPVFELAPEEVKGMVEKAKSLGCGVVFDGLSDPKVRSIVLQDTCGNEFELSVFHD